jgi:hypothetical protein
LARASSPGIVFSLHRLNNRKSNPKLGPVQVEKPEK